MIVWRSHPVMAPQKSTFLREMLKDCYHFSVELPHRQAFSDTMAEICISSMAPRVVCPPSSSKTERPFKLLVKNEVFTVDSEKLRNLSPVFALMCYGRDFEGGRELAREIVDEKSDDIATFLHCVHDPKRINEWNIPTLLRLANKYRVESLTDACCYYLVTKNLDNVKPDQILTLLMAAHDFHLPHSAVGALVLRLAAEDRAVHQKLKLSRFLTTQLYTSVIATSVNIAHIKEVETMNGHFFRTSGNRTQYKKTLCSMCRKIIDAAECEGCKLFLCREHSASNSCTSEFGARMLKKLKEDVVELEELD